MASTTHREGIVPPVAPCVVSHNLALGGAQIAVLRLIQCLPEWVRDRTTLYCQSDDMPLLDAAAKHGFDVGRVTTQAPADPSCWVLSYGKLQGLPFGGGVDLVRPLTGVHFVAVLAEHSLHEPYDIQ